ncbi:MAG: hypothetical protein QOH06_1396 [Acidobacteriota bacterium]|jgi:hypothetical protein|nr:hypothetical protein [Acidobacteriota bacterium]
MRIIKVLHECSAGEIQQSTLESYDTDGLIERILPGVVAQSHVAAVLALKRGVSSPAEAAAEAAAETAVRRVVHRVLADMVKFLDSVEVVSLADAKEKYANTANLSIGTYTLHPCDSRRLSRLEHFHKNLALEKDDELVVILGRMGAKSVRITEADSRQSLGAAGITFETLALSGQASGGIAGNMDRSQDLLVRFDGHQVEIDADLLRSSLWLSADSRLNAILESRRFSRNRMQQYAVANTYSETFDFDFNLAARHMIIDTDLKSEYQTISRRERLFHVEFGD